MKNMEVFSKEKNWYEIKAMYAALPALESQHQMHGSLLTGLSPCCWKWHSHHWDALPLFLTLPMSIPTTEISSFSSEDLFVQEESSQKITFKKKLALSSTSRMLVL
jgi:hypothetical protein